MGELKKNCDLNEDLLIYNSQLVEALNRVQAVIEFELDGTIITANDNFLSAVGYRLEEIKGKHHRIFCDDSYTNTLEYKNFWTKLSEGEFDSGEYKRITKAGDEIWINASYNPIFDDNGNPIRVVKFATDVTQQKQDRADFEGKINAISRSQAVIEFELDGTIITANDNFTSTLDYSLSEIKGRHHRIFCDSEYTESPEYTNFWRKLGNGEFESGEYKRITKTGKEIWINATYNPIFDAEGRPVKVVKFASDITEQKNRKSDFESQLSAIDKSQAVIEFNLDGTIISANDNFLNTVGYKLDEIKGQHHRIFCESEYQSSNEYKLFWDKLNRGIFDSGEYKRVGKNGNEIWINASYNPIFDLNGKVYKVVKYATDLTKEKLAYNNLVNTFEEAAKNILKSANELTTTSSQMLESANNTLVQSQSASTAVEEITAGIQNVGINTEEMTESIKDISKSAYEASSFSNDAKLKSGESNHLMEKLGNYSEEIGNVIKVISSIAQQTNLLALNATIEAARAGEAGKGFSVVASEVKELAKQTSNATDEISKQIISVQSSAKSSIEAISEVDNIISKLNQIAATTASAVEEQSATTADVSRIVLESSEGVKSISEVIRLVSISAEESTQGAEKNLEFSDTLKTLSENLLRLVADAK